MRTGFGGRSSWLEIDLDNVNFEEIVEYIAYARKNPWVLNRDNYKALEFDAIFSIIDDYFIKRQFDVHSAQVVMISKIVVKDLGIEDNTDEECKKVWKIVKPEEPPF